MGQTCCATEETFAAAVLVDSEQKSFHSEKQAVFQEKAVVEAPRKCTDAFIVPGHVLKAVAIGMQTSGNSSHSCSGCGRLEISAPEEIHRCFDCNYDVCGECVNKTVCSWRVVFDRPFPVHSSKTTGSKALGLKKPGTIIRGARDGEWIDLEGEHGFIRLVGRGTGKRVLQKELEYERAQAKTAKAAPPEEVCEWKVVSKMPFPVNQDRSTESARLVVKKPGAIFRGSREGDWVRLADEPGFMRIIGAKSGNRVLERNDPEAQAVDEKREARPSLGIAPWRVIGEKVVVFEDRADDSVIVGDKENGAVVRGAQDGDWLVLVGEPGFIKMRPKIDGALVLEQLSPKEAAAAIFALKKKKADKVEEQVDAPTPQVETSNSQVPVMAEVEAGEWCITLDKGPDRARKIGLDTVSCSIGSSRVLKIKRLKDGLVKEWNENNPGLEVKVGDFITETNGVRENSEELYRTIAKSQVLDMVVMRDVNLIRG